MAGPLAKYYKGANYAAYGVRALQAYPGGAVGLARDAYRLGKRGYSFMKGTGARRTRPVRRRTYGKMPWRPVNSTRTEVRVRRTMPIQTKIVTSGTANTVTEGTATSNDDAQFYAADSMNNVAFYNKTILVHSGDLKDEISDVCGTIDSVRINRVNVYARNKVFPFGVDPLGEESVTEATSIYNTACQSRIHSVNDYNVDFVSGNPVARDVRRWGDLARTLKIRHTDYNNYRPLFKLIGSFQPKAINANEDAGLAVKTWIPWEAFKTESGLGQTYAGMRIHFEAEVPKIMGRDIPWRCEFEYYMELDISVASRVA